MRYVVIGDVHGELDALTRLRARVQTLPRGGDAHLDEPTDRTDSCHTILAGDLVDRGPRSREVIEYVRAGVRDGQMSSVLGNHDEMFLQAVLLFRRDLFRAAGLDPDQYEPMVRDFRFAPQRFLRHWLSQGGDQTLRSYSGHAFHPHTWAIPPEHVLFLIKLPLAIRVPLSEPLTEPSTDDAPVRAPEDRDLTVTHARAGAHAVTEALRHRTNPVLVGEAARYQLLWSRTIPTDPVAGVHISGHTPHEFPLEVSGGWEIDTGCVFGNTLTAWISDISQMESVPCGRVANE